MSERVDGAPGWPGIDARWTSSAKSGVGTALSHDSRLWFTLSHGILNEVYYPRIDLACIRDMGFLVTGPDGFFSEEKRHAKCVVKMPDAGVPAYRLVNTCCHGRYRIIKDVWSDPRDPVLLQRVRFEPAKGATDLRLFVLLAPHLANRGSGNNGWIADYKGVPMLFAERDRVALALACSMPWRKRSVGFVGTSDGWQLLRQGRWDAAQFAEAENGNIALTAEIDLSQGREFVVALGFGQGSAEAAHRVRTVLQADIEASRQRYVKRWKAWQGELLPLDRTAEASPTNLYRTSTMVMHAHESLDFRGGLIASLSVPWGFSKGDEDLGGYHLIWPRDLVETAGGLLAAGALASVREVLAYLETTQEADGHWAQNMWLDGSPYWNGIQMDETALPVLLVDLAARLDALDAKGVARFWPMVRKATQYLLHNGPVSPQDRWEEDGGYSPFTVSTEIAALLAAADMAVVQGEPALAGYLRETADIWNDAIDEWMYATEADWCERFGVKGYYVRIAALDAGKLPAAKQVVMIKNVPSERQQHHVAHIVSPDALALVRFGLRAADDPRILDTLKVVDALLKVETPSGPSWHRYNGDGYGEHADGAPFDGTGIGRVWPLLTAERAHYELAAGHLDEARRLLAACEAFANAGGLLPEQIWDSPDIPARQLHFGHPAGSAMPLVWAHAEYVKLYRSLHDGKIFDLPPQTVQRYLVDHVTAPRRLWRFNHRIVSLPAGKALRIETLAPAVVHFSADAWHTTADVATRDTGLGLHSVDLPVARLEAGAVIRFTFRWPEAGHWEGRDFAVEVVAP